MEKHRKIKGILVLLLVGGLITVALIGLVRFYRIVGDLKSITPQQIVTFKIYPRKVGVRGEHAEFLASESIVAEFLAAVKDLRLNKSRRDLSAADEHAWVVELTTEDGRIFQIRCGLASFGVVVGFIDEIHHDPIWPYPDHRFESKALLQWYHAHSQQWLNSKENHTE
jgi:hypothetical protein